MTTNQQLKDQLHELTNQLEALQLLYENAAKAAVLRIEPQVETILEAFREVSEGGVKQAQRDRIKITQVGQNDDRLRIIHVYFNGDIVFQNQHQNPTIYIPGEWESGLVIWAQEAQAKIDEQERKDLQAKIKAAQQKINNIKDDLTPFASTGLDAAQEIQEQFRTADGSAGQVYSLESGLCVGHFAGYDPISDCILLTEGSSRQIITRAEALTESEWETRSLPHEVA